MLRVGDLGIGELALHAGPHARRHIESRQIAQTIAQRGFFVRGGATVIAATQVATHGAAAIILELAVEI